MTEKIEMQNTSGSQKPAKKTTKNVRNRSGHRVELLINDRIVVFLPGKITEVPIDFEIPNGLGLYVK